MGSHQIRTGWAVVVPDGQGGLTALGVFFDEEEVAPWRRRSDCGVIETAALTLGDETFILRTPRAFVADAGVSLREATVSRLSHTQRRLLGLPHNPDIAAGEPRSALSLKDDESERRRIIALVLTEEEATALGLREQQDAFWDDVREAQRAKVEKRREEIDAHPLIGRVFEAESNSEHAKHESHPSRHEYVVTGFDGESGRYLCRAHGPYAGLTPGSWNEKLLYSAEEIEAGPLAKWRRRDDLRYDDEGHPCSPRQRDPRDVVRIADHREASA